MITNITRKAILAKQHTLCTSAISKAIGLMFALKPKALVFAFSKPARISLHMLFVFFPIDVIYLDSKMRVVEIKESFKPFTFYTPKRKASFVIELPAGSAKGSKLGDIIELR